MKTMLMAASVAALSLASADFVLAQGNGKGNGGGGDKGGRAEQGGPGRDGGGDKADRGKGGGNENGAAKNDRGDARGPERRAEAQPDRRAARLDNRDGDDKGGRDDRPAQARAQRNDDRPDRSDRTVVLGDDRRDGGDRGDRIFRRVADRGLIAGCPPGLAKKNNGCLPPGQAKKLDAPQTRYDDVWDRWNDDYNYRYDDGYVYRMNQQGGLLGYLPVLGGALGLGQMWPAQYAYEPAPAYYNSYYDLPDRYQYRYADGAIYGVDPQTQMISQVAALLTGQDWNVGQAMPAGYDVYNVPYDYRSRYPDSPQSQYRYSDGYVYQVDPKTRLVQAVIQLLT